MKRRSTPPASRPSLPSEREEARELYGEQKTKRCPACEGKGETYGVLGDNTAGWTPCSACAGSGTLSSR